MRLNRNCTQRSTGIIITVSYCARGRKYLSSPLPSLGPGVHSSGLILALYIVSLRISFSLKADTIRCFATVARGSQSLGTNSSLCLLSVLIAFEFRKALHLWRGTQLEFSHVEQHLGYVFCTYLSLNQADKIGSDSLSILFVACLDFCSM